MTAQSASERFRGIAAGRLQSISWTSTTMQKKWEARFVRQAVWNHGRCVKMSVMATTCHSDQRVATLRHHVRPCGTWLWCCQLKAPQQYNVKCSLIKVNRIRPWFQLTSARQNHLPWSYPSASLVLESLPTCDKHHPNVVNYTNLYLNWLV